MLIRESFMVEVFRIYFNNTVRSKSTNRKQSSSTFQQQIKYNCALTHVSWLLHVDHTLFQNNVQTDLYLCVCVGWNYTQTAITICKSYFTLMDHIVHVCPCIPDSRGRSCDVPTLSKSSRRRTSVDCNKKYSRRGGVLKTHYTTHVSNGMPPVPKSTSVSLPDAPPTSNFLLV